MDIVYFKPLWKTENWEVSKRDTIVTQWHLNLLKQRFDNTFWGVISAIESRFVLFVSKINDYKSLNLDLWVTKCPL